MPCRCGSLLALVLAVGGSGLGCSGGEGTLPRDPVVPPVVDPVIPGVPGENTFADGQMLDVRLTMDPAVYADLEAHGDREEYVPAAATLQRSGQGVVSLASIGVRHKGSYSLHHCWDEFDGVRSRIDECEKLSLKLKFDTYDAAGRFDGLKRLNLHASSGDPSMLRELLAYSTFRSFGVDAPRALPARVSINGQVVGLFIAVEDVDGRYTAAHFPEAADGNLYKEVWPNAATQDHEFLAALETNEEGADISDMRQFADAVARSTPATFESELSSFIDVDALLRYVAVDRALRNWDGIMAFYSPRSPHNFYWYHDDGPDPRFHLIPWDLDNTFWAFDPYMHPEQWVTAAPIPDFNSRPLSCDPRPIWEPTNDEWVTPPRCDLLLNGLAESYWPRLVELGNELLAGPFSAARLEALAEQWAVVLEPLVAEDPTLDSGEFQGAVRELLRITPEAGSGFAAFLDEGLVEEKPVVVAPPEVPPVDIDAVTADSGLHVGSPTNFEFATPPEAAQPLGVFSYGDPLAVVTTAWSTAEPISGTADLRFDFTFNRAPGLYDEWVGVGINSDEQDVRTYTRAVVWLSTDVPRTVRVRLLSPAYTEAFGGVLEEFGADYAVGPEPRAVVIDFANVVYPSWAKTDWAAEQGFPGTDSEALDLVLQRFTGLAFGPAATMDVAGQLSTPTETGSLRIDNIYFR